ncbi:MAG: hypothetical protein IKX19_03705 [Clostridia bacterium]|nr:hypothetical protein [Clostridia bacterium]
MKRIFAAALAAVLLCALTLTAAAVPNGTVVNHTMYTDIIARIDSHPIRAYNVDNRMVVVAEDLRGYGFYAIWHAEERWLEVTRPVENGEPAVPAVYPDYTPTAPAGKVGTPAHDILATDIVTTVAGDTVESWNINGETCILFRDLARYGDVDFDSETRTALFVTMPYKVLAGGHAVEDEGPEGFQWTVAGTQTEESMTAVFTVGQESAISTFLAADETDVTFDLFWSVDTDPVPKVTLAFYPGQFLPQKTLREKLCDKLSALSIPSASDTVDFTNTPSVRAAVSEVLRVALNGRAVTGDLFRTQGNGHVDFVFLFDKGIEVRPGDTITVVIEAGT